MNTKKLLHNLETIAVLGLALAFLAQPAAANTYTWSSSTSSVTDGPGNWDNVTPEWWNSGTAQAWNNASDTAVFGVAAGSNSYTVTLSNGISVGGITFQNQAYTISGDTVTLALSSGTSTIAVNSGVIGTIDSAVSDGGTGVPLNKTGPGALVLNGPAAYTGATTVSGGSLLINNTDTTSSISVGLNAVLGGAGSASLATATFAATKGTLNAGYGGAGSLTLGGLNTGLSNDVVSIIIPTISDATSVPAVNVIGNLTCAGPSKVTFYLNGVLSGSGSIPLLYAGSGISSLNGAKLNAQNITGGGSVSLSESAATGYLYLNYSGYNYLIWSGTGSGVWSTASQSPTNWLSSGGGAANFVNNQTVVFGDSAGTTTVSISGNVSPASVTFNNNSLSYTLTGASGIAGYTSLIMNGSGAVTIGTSNSYYGGTTINAGRLKIANAAALGGPTAMSTYGTFTINGGTIDNSSGGPLTLPNYPIAWNAGFVFPGSNPLNLGAGAVTLGNSAATVNLSGSTLTLGGPIGDNGMGYGFTQNGAGVLALGGGAPSGSTYSGPTVVNGGTLSLGNGASINGTSSVNLAAANTVLVLNHTDSQTFAPTVGGSGGLVQTGVGMVTLANSNTYTGGTVITGGTLALGNSLALQNSTLNTSGSGILSFGSQTAATFGGLTGPGTLALGNTASAAVTLSVGNNNANTTFSGMMTGPGGLTKIGAGALTLTATNSFFGTTSVSSGTLVVANAAALQNSTVNIAANTNIVFSVSAANVAGLSGSGNLNLGAVALTVGANNANSNFPGSLSGGNGLTKAGSGTLVMTGMNTYGGPTVIKAGTVQLGDEIIGFGANTSGSAGQSNGTWQFNNIANTATPVTGGTLNLTASLGGEARSAFYMTAVPVGAFNATFVYQAGGNKAADGSTFMLQNDPRGPSALGSAGGALGYTGPANSAGIVNSAGIGMNLYASANPLGSGAGPGVYQLQSGQFVSSTTTPDHTFFGSGDPIQVNVSYDGSNNLSATFLDLSTGASYPESYYIGSLASITGGSTAYVGFSGGDGGSTSTQTISKFILSYNAGAFTNVLPVTTALSISAGATLDLSGNSQTVGSLAGAGTVTNYSANALSVLTAGGDNSSQTFSGVLLDGYGTLGLIKAGSGSLTLTGSNVYSGGTTVGGGTLQLGNGAKNGSVAGDILNNSALVFANSTAQLYTGVISGGGSLTKNGPGTLQLSATHTYTGPTVINAGTVQLGTPLLVSSFGTNTAGGTQLAASTNVTHLTNGTWTFNSYSYSTGFLRTPVTGGSLDLTDGTSSGAGTGCCEARSAFYNIPVPVNTSFQAKFTYTPGNVANSMNSANGFTFILQNQYSGTGSLGGAGRGFGVGADPQGPFNNNPIIPSAEIEYDVFQGASYTGATSGAVTGYNTDGGVDIGTKIFGGNSYVPGDAINMTVTYNALTNVLSWSGTDAGPTYTGTKTLTFSESQAGVDLQGITGGTSAYVGFTGGSGFLGSTQTVTNFSFTSAVNGNLPSTTALFISKSGALDLFGADQTVGDLSGAGTVTNSFPAGTVTLTIGGDGTSQIFSGTIRDGLGQTALAISGGTLTLSGTNTYTGGTTVSGNVSLGSGVLIVTNDEAIADGTSLAVGDPSLLSMFGGVVSASTEPGLPAGATSTQTAPVPEPGALALAAAGAVLLALYRKRCRHQSCRQPPTP